jgi:hypothetical protein
MNNAITCRRFSVCQRKRAELEALKVADANLFWRAVSHA